MPGNAMSCLDPNYKTICILVSGPSGMGKTTICDKLQSDKTMLISMDHIHAVIRKFDDPILLPYFNEIGSSYQCINVFSALIEEFCPEYYAQKIFENIIETVACYPIIVIEGYTLSMPKFRKFLIEKLEEHNFIVWSLVKGDYNLQS